MTDKQMIDEETLEKIINLRERLNRLESSFSHYFSDEGQSETISIIIADRNNGWVQIDKKDFADLLMKDIEIVTTQLKQLGYSPTPPPTQEGGENV